MAVLDEAVLVSELNKLKKPELISLIVHKRLPGNVVSDVLSKFLEGGDVEGGIGLNSSSPEILPGSGAWSVSHGDCAVPDCIRAKCIAEYSAKELSSKEEVLCLLKKRVSDLESIIDLMKTKNPRKPSHNPPSLSDFESQDTNSNAFSALFTDYSKKSSAEVVRQTSVNNKQGDNTDNARSVISGMPGSVNKPRVLNKSVVRDNSGNKPGKRSQVAVYGSKCDLGDIKGVPRMGYVHVSKLDPETTADSVSRYLDQIVPNCKCEMLDSRFPEIYSSFKVSVPLDDVDKIMNPSVWPTGVRLNRFFHRRQSQPVKV